MTTPKMDGAASSGDQLKTQSLPPGAEVQQVEFVKVAGTAHTILLKIPDPSGVCAILATDGSESPPNQVTGNRLQILTIPTVNHHDPALQDSARNWLNAAEPDLHLMTLQGALVFWTAEKMAAMAPAGRLETVRRSLIEAFWFERELSRLETDLAAAWPQMENSAPLAFVFDEKSIRRRPQLLREFEHIVSIRSRLAQMAPHIHRPHIHPPTLAGQLAERFRERSRMVHRYDILTQQLEFFERIYDACGQRAGDFMQTRSGNILEWIIIVLLLTQILLWGVDILTSNGQ
jgi:hypothetical protein